MTINTKKGKFLIIPILLIKPGIKFRFNKKWYIKYCNCFMLSNINGAANQSRIFQMKDYEDKSGAIKI